jgi:hypothetical protein
VVDLLWALTTPNWVIALDKEMREKRKMTHSSQDMALEGALLGIECGKKGCTLLSPFALVYPQNLKASSQRAGFTCTSVKCTQQCAVRMRAWFHRNRADLEAVACKKDDKILCVIHIK